MGVDQKGADEMLFFGSFEARSVEMRNPSLEGRLSSTVPHSVPRSDTFRSPPQPIWERPYLVGPLTDWLKTKIA